MSDRHGPIRRVLVAGGGLVGWSAAAALQRRLPWLEVVILPIAPPADAIADRIHATLPSILGFHEDLGLSDADAVVRTGSNIRLGTLFEGWTTGRAGHLTDYVHAYGRHGRPFEGGSFHLHWARAARHQAPAPFDRFSAAAVMARAGRFAVPADDPEALVGGFEHGLHIDPVRYAAMLRAFALHCGVRERAGDLTGVEIGEDGFVAAALLAEGDRVEADLFVDATGPAARLRSALDDARISWASWLPCDRLILEDAAAMPADPLDRVTAHGCGWRWTGGGSQGLVYASAFAGAAEWAGQGVAIDPGTRSRPWLRNCVAIGDAATAVEPLEWTNLHLAHSAIDRIVAMLPGRDCAPVELAEYNRQCAAEAERVRDFLALHYAVSDRPEPFWRAAAGIAPPPSLAHSLAQFRARGRLPFYEEETFAKDSWLAVLIGQNVLPERDDPLIGLVPPDRAAAAMTHYAQALAAAVAALPPAGAAHPILQRS